MPISVFRPGDVDNTNFRDIPTVRPTGLQAESAFYGTVAREMDKVSQTFDAIQKEKNKLAEREALAQIKIAEKDLEQIDPAAGVVNTPTQAKDKAAGAVVNATVQGYNAKLELDLQSNLARIASETAGDPERMRQRMSAYIDQGETSLPAEIAGYYRENATREANSYLQKSTQERMNSDVEEGKATVITLVNTQQEQLQSSGQADSPVAQSTFELRGAKYKVALDNAVNAGYLTPAEAELRVMEVRDSMMESAIVGEIQRAPNKLQFALNVAAGKSGTYLDQASPKQRLQGLAAAQSLASVEDQIQARKDREIARASEANFVRNQKAVMADPFADHSKRLKSMFDNATTIEALGRYEKMKDYLDNAEDELYNKSDRKTLMLFDMRATKGTLRQADLDEAFGNLDASKRIGANDYNRLTAQLDRDRESLTESLAFKTLNDRLELEFPVPKTDGMEGIAANLAAKMGMPAPASFASAEQKQVWQNNEQLHQEVLLDAREAIRDGRITSPEQLTMWGEQRLNQVRTSRGQGGYKRQVDLDPPMVKLAKQKVFANGQTTALYHAYKNNRKAFIRAIKDGKIDMATANLLDTAFGTVPRETPVEGPKEW